LIHLALSTSLGQQFAIQVSLELDEPLIRLSLLTDRVSTLLSKSALALFFSFKATY